MEYLKAFIVGGIICVFGQILMDRTKLMPGRITVLFVVIGTLLTGFGLYQPIVNFGGAGATVPISGFGYALGKGVMKEVTKEGFVGIFTGGLKATAGGVTAAILFGFLSALLFSPKAKE
ncbi:MAG: stage V sporulation protein AE [Epulopiscium sp.]|nr:stage V sporulation protein AE [Candidatus Epulonipiscium sp.]